MCDNNGVVILWQILDIEKGKKIQPLSHTAARNGHQSGVPAGRESQQCDWDERGYKAKHANKTAPYQEILWFTVSPNMYPVCWAFFRKLNHCTKIANITCCFLRKITHLFTASFWSNIAHCQRLISSHRILLLLCNEDSESPNLKLQLMRTETPVQKKRIK